MAPLTLAELQRLHEEALYKAAHLRTALKDLEAEYRMGVITSQAYTVTKANIETDLRSWNEKAREYKEAIDALAAVPPAPVEPRTKEARIRELVAKYMALLEEAVDGQITADLFALWTFGLLEELRLLGYSIAGLPPYTPPPPVVPPPVEPPEDAAGLRALAERVAGRVQAMYALGPFSTAELKAATKAAYDAIMAGKTEAEALAAAEALLKGTGKLDPMAAMSGLLRAFGNLGSMATDAGVGAQLSGPIAAFLDTLGVSPEALRAVMASPLDREKAAQIATGVATAAQAGLGILLSVGVIAEVASLGQIESVVHATDMLLHNTGLDEILRPLFTAAPYAALTVPVRQYWMSVFKPTIPGIQDLRLMAVREAFPVETREQQFAEMARWGAYQGLDTYWADRYLAAGYERMAVPDALRAFSFRRAEITRRLLHGEITEGEAGTLREGSEKWLRGFLSIADIHPDDHDEILRALWSLPTRYERRHGYIMGVFERRDLVEMFQKDGLTEADADTSTEAMIAYALNAERNAVGRAAGVVYRETLEELAIRLRKLDMAVGDAMDALEATRESLQAKTPGVTSADVALAEEGVEHARSALGSLKRRAEGIRTAAEAGLRAELASLLIVGDRQDLWVRRYAMEARIKTRPTEILEELIEGLEFEGG